MRRFIAAAVISALLPASCAYCATLQEELSAAQSQAAKFDKADLGDQSPNTLTGGLEGKWAPVVGAVSNVDQYMGNACKKTAYKIGNITDDGFTMDRNYSVPSGKTVPVSVMFKRFADGSYLQQQPISMIDAMSLTDATDNGGKIRMRFLAARSQVTRLIRPSENVMIVALPNAATIYARCQ